MLQTHILRENSNKILMQCLHSRHANITHVKLQLQWDKTYLYWCKYHISQNILKRSKNEKHEFNVIAYAKETQDIYVIL